jgi:hypothetical protein
MPYPVTPTSTAAANRVFAVSTAIAATDITSTTGICPHESANRTWNAHGPPTTRFTSAPATNTDRITVR